MRYLVFLVALVVIVSCHRSGRKASEHKLDAVKRDMSMHDVLAVTGEPTRSEDLGTATDERGDTTHMVKWYYGDNETIMFVNGKVNDVDTDVKATQDHLQHIMDSAKAASGR